MLGWFFISIRFRSCHAILPKARAKLDIVDLYLFNNVLFEIIVINNYKIFQMQKRKKNIQFAIAKS